MKIKRSGSHRWVGVSTITADPAYNWDEKEGAIQGKAYKIRDFNTTSNHDYRIELNKNDISRIIDALSRACKTNPKQMTDLLSGSQSQLIELLYASTRAETEE